MLIWLTVGFGPLTVLYTTIVRVFLNWWKVSTLYLEKPKNKYNNALGEAAEAYGDPHFMVSSIGSEPICFDYNPEPRSTIMLLTDPESNLVVTGTISNEKVDNKTFIDEILFMSPNGAQLTFNTDGVQLRGLSVRDHIQQEEQETIQYNDIQFVEKWLDLSYYDRIG